MRKLTVFWLIIAVVLILTGGAVFTGAMIGMHWDFSKLSTAQMEINEYTFSDKFNNISINTDTADITFIPIEDGKTKVVCKEFQNARHLVTVTDDALQITLQDSRKWYEHIGIFIDQTEITVYLSQKEYKNLKLDADTGDVELPSDFLFENMDISLHTGDMNIQGSVKENVKLKATTGDICYSGSAAGDMDISVSTGKILLSGVSCAGDIQLKVSTGDTDIRDVQCQNLSSNGSTGDLYLKNVIASGNFTLERSTGHICFDRCDAAKIFANTDTGSLTGSLLSEKIFMAQSDTGNVNVPKTASGGVCELTTNTGNIRIEIILE